MPPYLPSLLVLGGAIIAAFGAFIGDRKRSAANVRLETLAVQNHVLSQEISTADEEKTELMRKIVALSGGDEQTLRKLIEANTALLSAERRTGESLLGDVLAKLPKTKETYLQVQADSASAYAKAEAEFRLSWESLIRFVVTRFDQAAAELKANGYSTNFSGSDEFSVVTSGEGKPGSMQHSVTIGTARAQLYLVTAHVNERGRHAGVLEIEVLKNDVNYGGLRLDLSFERVRADGNAMPDGAYTTAAAGGKIPDELVTKLNAAIAKVMERLLLVSDSSK